MRSFILPGIVLALVLRGGAARAQQMPPNAAAQNAIEIQNKAILAQAGATALMPLPPNAPYVWLDNTTLLSFSLRPPARGELLAFDMVKWDTEKKKEAAVGRLSAWFVETKGDPYSLQIAPDGKHLLWTGMKIGPERPGRPATRYFAVIADVEGQTKSECLIDDIGFIPKYPERWYGGSFADRLRWMPDSRHWIEFVPANYRRKTPGAALIREMADEKITQTIPVDPMTKINAPGVPSLYGGQWLILKAGAGYRNNANDTTTTRLRFDGKFSVLGVDTLWLPVDRAAYNDWQISPDGSRMVWVRDTDPSLPAQQCAEIWTAPRSSYGKDKRRLIAILIGPNDKTFHMLENTRWLPDGKRISFCYHGTLYVLPDKAK